MFAMDTIETNLVEFLFAQNYDIWLLDYRLSIDLDASKQPSSLTDIAMYDIPTAIDYVLEQTKVDLALH